MGLLNKVAMEFPTRARSRCEALRYVHSSSTKHANHLHMHRLYTCKYSVLYMR
jgi:hypothetical protein